jgi:hypothetical protein
MSQIEPVIGTTLTSAELIVAVHKNQASLIIDVSWQFQLSFLIDR